MSSDRPHRLSVLALVIFTAIATFSLDAATEPPPRHQSPSEIVDNAHKAVTNAEFDALIPLLENLVSDDDVNAPPMAHLLYALGLVYEAPSEAEDDYFATVNRHIEVALKSDADIELDPLVYPPKFIARIEEIRHRLKSTDTEITSPAQPSIFYFERHVEVRSRLPLFFPAGVGQFYNDANFRGVTFATVQTAGLAANILGHWMVDSMRTSSGHIPSEDMSRARDWRRLQYAGLATFAAGWIIGVIEANLGFEARTVRIRTLDSPPEELDIFSDSHSDSGLSLQLRWGLRF